MSWLEYNTFFQEFIRFDKKISYQNEKKTQKPCVGLLFREGSA